MARTPAASGSSTSTTRKPRTAKSADEVVANARKAITRATASVMHLHLKALNTDGIEPIAKSAKELVKALVAPPANEK